MRSACLPNFFLAGAPKTGTTSLYHYLRQHPDIYLTAVKEPCFFATEMRPDNFSRQFAVSMRQSSLNLLKYLDGPMSGHNPGGIITDWNRYLELFKNVTTETAIGEASACYLWSAKAPANIHAQIPNAKIVVILRDPVERAFSQYLQYAAGGLLTRGFRQHVDLCLRNNAPIFGLLSPFLEYGLYYEQVKRYLDLFSPPQVRIYLYEEAWRNPQQLLRDLFCFLGVDVQVEVDTSVRSLQRRAPKWTSMQYLLRKSGLLPVVKRLLPASFQEHLRAALFRQKSSLQLDPKDRQYVIEYYRDDIQNLSNLLGRDLGAWLK
jgi:hypothetical protein